MAEITVTRFVLSACLALPVCLVAYFVLVSLLNAIFEAPTRAYMRDTASIELEKWKALYSGRLDWVETSPKDLPWLDKSFYNKATENMLQAGFKLVGEFESLALTRVFPNMRTLSRCFVEDNATTMAAVFHIKVRGLRGLLSPFPRHNRVVEFVTEFTDHTFLGTNNTLGLQYITACPEVTENRMPIETEFETMLESHRQQIQHVFKTRGVKTIAIRNKQDLLASQERMHALNCEYKNRIGFVTLEDAEELVGGKLSYHQKMQFEEFQKEARGENSPGEESL